MAEGGDVHPGSWIGDSVEEYKKLPTWGKIAIPLVLVAVVAFAIYKKNQAAAGTTANSAAAGSLAGSTAAGMSGASNTAGLGTVPTSSSGNVPIIPPGYTGIFDNLGNLIGWQMPTSTTPAPTSPSPTPTKPSPTPTTGGATPPSTKPTPKLSTYTVVRGDSLSGIAARLHTPGGWQTLYANNRSVVGSNPNLIYAGQVLKV